MPGSDLERAVSGGLAVWEKEGVQVTCKNLIPRLVLKDQNDRHVLAAAIAAKADFLLTFNLKDFPSKEVSTYGISVISPDDFIFGIERLP